MPSPTELFLQEVGLMLGDCSNDAMRVGLGTLRRLHDLALSGQAVVQREEALLAAKAEAEEDVGRIDALEELYGRGCYLRKVGGQYELVSPAKGVLFVSSTLREVMNNYIMATRVVDTRD